MKNILNFIIDLLFPRTCLICNKILNSTGYTGICISCFKKVELFDINLFPELKNIITKSNFDTFDSPFIYSDKISQLILNFKFHDQEEKGIILSNLLNRHIKQIENYQNCLIVPVPIHKKRLAKRKFNQSSMLAKHLSKKNNIPYSNKALKRIIDTPHQTGVSKAKRTKQLKNSFLANNKLINQKDIILIDDVFTTGTTVNLCAEELKKKGANKVHVLTLAYTPL